MYIKYVSGVLQKWHNINETVMYRMLLIQIFLKSPGFFPGHFVGIKSSWEELKLYDKLIFR